MQGSVLSLEIRHTRDDGSEVVLRIHGFSVTPGVSKDEARQLATLAGAEARRMADRHGAREVDVYNLGDRARIIARSHP